MTHCDSHTVQVSVSAADKSAADAENWLGQNVVVQYWKAAECESRPSANCRFSNVAIDWFVFEVFFESWVIS